MFNPCMIEQHTHEEKQHEYELVCEQGKQREHELALRKLELKQPVLLLTVMVSHHYYLKYTFKLEQAIKLLPRFNEQNVEEHLIGFENVTEINNWPHDSC